MDWTLALAAVAGCGRKPLGLCLLLTWLPNASIGLAQQVDSGQAVVEINGQARRVVRFDPRSLPAPPAKDPSPVRMAIVPGVTSQTQPAEAGNRFEAASPPSLAELSPPSLDVPLPQRSSPATSEPGAAAESQSQSGLQSTANSMAQPSSRATLPIEAWESPGDLVSPRFRVAELRPPIAATTPPTPSLDLTAEFDAIHPPRIAAESESATSAPRQRAQPAPGDENADLASTMLGRMESPDWTNEIRFPMLTTPSQLELSLGDALRIGLQRDDRLQVQAVQGGSSLAEGPRRLAEALGVRSATLATAADHLSWWTLSLPSNADGQAHPPMLQVAVPLASSETVETALEAKTLAIAEAYTQLVAIRGQHIVARRQYHRLLALARRTDLTEVTSARLQSDLAEAHGELVATGLQVNMAQNSLVATLSATESSPGIAAEILPTTNLFGQVYLSSPPNDAQTNLGREEQELQWAATRQMAVAQVVYLRAAEWQRLPMDPQRLDLYLACQERLQHSERELVNRTLTAQRAWLRWQQASGSLVRLAE